MVVLLWDAQQASGAHHLPFSGPPCSSLGPLYFTYGLVFACGCSFSYQPSLVILGHYFQRRLGLVNGIVTAGSSIFTIILPFMLSGLLERMGLYYTMRVLCILLFVLMLAGFTYKPLLPAPASDTRAGRRCPPANQIFNFNIWKSVGYRIWAFGIPAALYGYFVPYVHLVSPSAMLSLEFVLFVLLLLLLLLLISAQKSNQIKTCSTQTQQVMLACSSTCPKTCWMGLAAWASLYQQGHL